MKQKRSAWMRTLFQNSLGKKGEYDDEKNQNDCMCADLRHDCLSFSGMQQPEWKQHGG